MSRSARGVRTTGGSGSPHSITELGKRQRKKSYWIGEPLNFQFTSINEIKEYLDNPKLECLLCGRCFELLAQHLRIQHATNRREYNIRFGIPLSWKLAGNAYVKRASEQANERLKHGERERLQELSKKFQPKAQHSHIHYVPCEAVKNKLRNNNIRRCESMTEEEKHTYFSKMGKLSWSTRQ